MRDYKSVIGKGAEREFIEYQKDVIKLITAIVLGSGIIALLLTIGSFSL